MNLIDQKEPTLNFQNINEEKDYIKNIKVDYYKKIIKPSSTEIKNHTDYLKQYLKKNYF